MPEEILPLSWKKGMLTRVPDDGGHIFALEQFGNKYVGRSFIVDLKQYRKPVPSPSKTLQWGPNSVPEQGPYRGEAIVFEVSEEGQTIVWCSRREFLEAGFKMARKSSKVVQMA